ncbi:hypothetical protein CcrC1_gp481 [Caulobacter phage C1]|nr:hypothetical protein CcrC1_gp481 [Caulobacter phage C1]UTU08692.1 hypothetical protein CcrC2_gp465 [Caulobacter phage C2]UTU09226.1 hypothetical protein CcrJ4_gp479 [Caulobacter phage J4]WGN97356.1 hypothetical protein [Bertelyvirus sp.]WGN97894.1 hypothetical protein [Bertelyvirus sp.]
MALLVLLLTLAAFVFGASVSEKIYDVGEADDGDLWRAGVMTLIFAAALIAIAFREHL